MKKYVLDLKVTENISIHNNYILMKLTTLSGQLPEMLPGQFVEVRVDGSSKTFLRRPISINYVDREKNELWLLIQLIGEGTKKLSTVIPGEIVNLIFPLGNSFTLPSNPQAKTLLVGGGCGTAPMLFLGEFLKNHGFNPAFLLGARSAKDVLQLNDFEKVGDVYVTTEDGCFGEKGFVTQHTILETQHFDKIYTCGPKPMMMAVASFARKNNIECEVSLENTMACGFGVCLCCVENTTDGHVCVCKEGPVFNIDKLKWQI